MRNIRTRQDIAVSPQRRGFDFRRMRALLGACAVSLLAGACAHNVADAPVPQWQFNTAESAPEAPASGPADVSSSYQCGGNPSGWASSCYVYRGGRDPNTGLAQTQM